MNTNANWKTIDRWNLDDWADGTELMIVEKDGTRYLLSKLRKHPALPATWCVANRVMPTDTRDTLEADAGLDCPMLVCERAINGYDSNRPIMPSWSDAIIRNIADDAR